LNFNFPINFNQQPDLYADAAISNLFFSGTISSTMSFINMDLMK